MPKPPVKAKEPKVNPFLRPISIPLIAIVVFLLALAGGVYYCYQKVESEKEKAIADATNNIDNVTIRLNVEGRYKLIRPLAFVEFLKEDSHLLNIKSSVLSFVEQQKAAGNVTHVSAYLRDMNKHQDVRMNPTEIFFPGSLMKVPIMITYLKAVERDPEIMSQKFLFQSYYGNLPTQNITSKAIVPGNSYSVSELLEYMIVYSDNNATAVLSEHVNWDDLIQVFSDLQLPVPDKASNEYGITLKEYSRFFRVLINSTYLSRRMSEYALELLVRCEFNDGMKKYIDPSVTVAHKFGERNSDGVQQLHEVGLFYLKDRVYLLGVMTKGNDIGRQKEVISQISKMVYDAMKARKED